jgi:hypothetical protein
MRYRSLFLLMVLATSSGAAEELPAGEPVASAVPVKTAANAATAELAQSAPAKDREQTQAKDAGGDKALSGMSILGNQEAPKSLVIVPWKSSEMGDTLGLSEELDDARKPVDKQVFMRELSYYEIRSGSK